MLKNRILQAQGGFFITPTQKRVIACSKALTQAHIKGKVFKEGRSFKLLVLEGLELMKISLNWLNDYVRTELPAQKIADILSDLGFPYEGIEYLKDDAVIDFEITSNRGDCLSHIGIARELAAAAG
ncbi:MAG: hypothetical protein NTZ12_01900, partial [Candidatus Aminicenantes bacterium]|nr:hypothetical protein [Candidatus Aminicenantes bacterium]